MEQQQQTIQIHLLKVEERKPCLFTLPCAKPQPAVTFWTAVSSQGGSGRADFLV